MKTKIIPCLLVLATRFWNAKVKYFYKQPKTCTLNLHFGLFQGHLFMHNILLDSIYIRLYQPWWLRLKVWVCSIMGVILQRSLGLGFKYRSMHMRLQNYFRLCMLCSHTNFSMVWSNLIPSVHFANVNILLSFA